MKKRTVSCTSMWGVKMVKKHFVKFFSPGSFVDEVSVYEIEDWDTKKAILISKKVNERYNSKPFAFIFITKENDGTTLDSRTTAKSGLYYLNGEIKTLQNIIDENNNENRILISNMKNNGWKKVIITNTPWKKVSIFDDNEDINLSKEYIDSVLNDNNSI